MNKNDKRHISAENNPNTQIEKAYKKRKSQRYFFRLYISGMTTRSMRAIENIRRLCEENLKGKYELEVIDIYKHPDKARSEQIIAAPTLIKQLPLPLRRFIGDLSDLEKVLVGLEVKVEASKEDHK
jgi:circadian clock protein KaiB